MVNSEDYDAEAKFLEMATAYLSGPAWGVEAPLVVSIVRKTPSWPRSWANVSLL
jgi:hypothetical protein